MKSKYSPIYDYLKQEWFDYGFVRWQNYKLSIDIYKKVDDPSVKAQILMTCYSTSPTKDIDMFLDGVKAGVRELK